MLSIHIGTAENGSAINGDFRPGIQSESQDFFSPSLKSALTSCVPINGTIKKCLLKFPEHAVAVVKICWSPAAMQTLQQFIHSSILYD